MKRKALPLTKFELNQDKTDFESQPRIVQVCLSMSIAKKGCILSKYIILNMIVFSCLPKDPIQTDKSGPNTKLHYSQTIVSFLG